MLFNSLHFLLLFLPLTLFVFFVLHNNVKARVGWLILSSLFFYGYWNPSYLPLISASILFNYFLGCQIKNTKTRFHKRYLLFGVLVNVLVLFYFKYSHSVLNLSGVAIVLPLAISFFTFQQIAYLSDCMTEKKRYNFAEYCLFILFFPQLIAGPIVHAKETIFQFTKAVPRAKHIQNIQIGLTLFSIGLAKKLILADSMAEIADGGYGDVATLGSLSALVTILAYSFQIYFDFSGYSDMAIGIAKMFNVNLPENFNAPYQAANIKQFWRRWHMTLSRWLRDYVYIVLGGNRKSLVFVYINLLLTFIIGGIWHGAGWTFFIWGALHGLSLIIFNLWQRFGFALNASLSVVITFAFTSLAWVFFRSESVADAVSIIALIFSSNLFVFDHMVEYANTVSGSGLVMFVVCAVVVFIMPTSHQLTQYIQSSDFSMKSSVAVCAILLGFLLEELLFKNSKEFIYFQF